MGYRALCLNALDELRQHVQGFKIAVRTVFLSASEMKRTRKLQG